MNDDLHFHIPMYAARGIANSMPKEAQLAFLALAKQSPEAAIDLIQQIAGEIEVTTSYIDRARDHQIDYLVLNALDYALPRMTASGQTLRDTIEQHWNDLQDQTRTTIIDKVTAKIGAGQAGDRMDERDWAAFIERIQAPGTGPKI